MSDEWSIILTLHCSRIVTICLHTLQALTVMPARTLYKPMMALILDALKICARALGTCAPSCTGRPARLLFMLEARGTQGAMRHVAAPESTSAGRQGPKPYDTWQRRISHQPRGKVWSHRTRGSAGTHLSLEARSGATRQVAALELTSVGR
jgi:hypothetical protein